METPLETDIQYSGAELRKKTEDAIASLRDTLVMIPEFREAVIKKFFAGRLDGSPLNITVFNAPYGNHSKTLELQVKSFQDALDNGEYLDHLDVTILSRFVRNPRVCPVPDTVAAQYHTCQLNTEHVAKEDSHAQMIYIKRDLHGNYVTAVSNSHAAATGIQDIITELQLFLPRR